MSEMIEAVNQGKELPTLALLDKWQKIKQNYRSSTTKASDGKN